MATLIYVDQENVFPSTNGGSKDRVRLPSASTKVLSERPQMQGLRLGKVLKASPVARQGLADITINIGKAPVGTQTKMAKPRLQQPSAKNGRKHSDVEYPEIEKCIPYNPLDFECFDVPEEHRLSHLCLAGVSLQTMEMERFDRHVNLMPSPLKPSSFTWESDILHLPFLYSLAETTVDLPPLLGY
ncbi:securin-like [Lissotriton helveticus]